MKINLQTPLLDFQGRNLPQTYFGVRSNNPVNFAFVAVTALGTAFQDEKNLSEIEKVKRYDLAVKLLYAEEVELTIEEAGLIKKCVGKLGSPMVYGQVDRILEGKDTGIKQFIPEEDPKASEEEDH